MNKAPKKYTHTQDPEEGKEDMEHGTAVTRHWVPASMFLMKINDDVLLC
jgi:hypothetical protein